MPISGLPNPQIHRLCKRCRQWFDAHEGFQCWPPKTGLLSWVHVTLSENTEQASEQKFFCNACQEKNGKDAARFIKGFKTIALTMVAIAAMAGAAWAFGLVEWFKTIVQN